MAAAKTPPSITVLVQDVSVLVSREPAYDGSQFGFPGWEVVALCADAPTLEGATSVEFAVLPAEAVTDAIAKEIKVGRFADSVTCDGRRYHG